MKKQVILLLVIFIFVQIAISEPDFDMDGIADSQDKFPYDYDNDGMPDSWEKSNGLRFDVDDTKFDYDNDGLNNLVEYSSKTDPFSADSDGDKISDKDELEANTNPLDPKSPSKFDFNNLIIVLLAIFALIGITAIIYSIIKIKKREKKPLVNIKKQITKPAAPQKTTPLPKIMMHPTKEPISREKIYKIRRMEKTKEREGLFKAFEEKSKKPMIKEPVHKELSVKLEDFKKAGFKKEHAAELSQLVKKSDIEEPLKKDVFDKISTLTKVGLPKKKKEDAFKELTDVIKRKI